MIRSGESRVRHPPGPDRDQRGAGRAGTGAHRPRCRTPPRPMTGRSAARSTHPPHGEHPRGKQRRAADAAIAVAEARLRRRGSSASPGRVLTTDTPSAPASRATTAMPAMSGSTGDSLATSGRFVTRRHRATIGGHRRRIGAELDAAGGGVGTGEIQLVGGDAVEVVEALDDRGVLLEREADHVDQHPRRPEPRAAARASRPRARARGRGWRGRPS